MEQAADAPRTQRAVAAPHAQRRVAAQRALAKRLARRLTSARSSRKRQRAIMQVVRRLGVPVVTSRGRKVAAPSGLGPVYLYDFEVRAMSSAAGWARRVSGTQLGQEVVAAVITPATADVSRATGFTAVLRRATRRRLRRAGEREALPALLVRELGLRKRPRYDLAKQQASDVMLDPMQRFLILADIAAGGLRKRTVATSSEQKRTAEPPSHIDRATARPAIQCPELDEWFRKSVNIGKWAVPPLIDSWLKKTGQEIPLLKTAGNIARAATAIIDVVHAGILSLSLDFKQARGGLQNSETHYGPPGHPTSHYPEGEDLVFQVGVQMLFEVPEDIVRCGKLAGVRFPPKGPVGGVPINWFRFGWTPLKARQILERHGEILREDTTTDPKTGLAIFVFHPKDEILPGLGPQRTDASVLQPTADFFTPFGSTLGHLPELLTPPHITLPFVIEWHEQQPIELEVDTTITYRFPGGQETLRVRAAPIPLTTDWNGTGRPGGERQPNYLDAKLEFSGGVLSCIHWNGATLDQPFRVHDLTLDWTGSLTPAITLRVAPPNPVEHWLDVNCGLIDDQSFASVVYAAGLYSVHAAERVPGTGVCPTSIRTFHWAVPELGTIDPGQLDIRDWEFINTGGVIARKTFTAAAVACGPDFVTTGSGDFVERTVLILRTAQ